MPHAVTKTFSLDAISTLPIALHEGERLFLYGDLGAGKTTLTKHLINAYLWDESPVGIKSPTYVYYHCYAGHIYHFDLYRLGSYEEFVSIGGEEILDASMNICIIEWPEILEGHYDPTMRVSLARTSDESIREARIEKL